MGEEQFRAEFDAHVDFSNGGHLSVELFRVDVPGPEVTESEVAFLFVASLGLLMAERIELSGLRVFPEAHKGTRGGPSDAAADPPRSGELIELSHVIEPRMTTYPGLPGPEITPHITREASRANYAPGTEFAIDRISMVGNTGTYLDTAYHRYRDGADLAALHLEQVANVPAIVVRSTGSYAREVDIAALAAFDVAGKAVLLHTGGDRGFGTPGYAENAPYLTARGAQWLAAHGAFLVGIDSVNIDAIDDPTRPAHSILLAAGIPIVEHLTGLHKLPPHGSRFTAAPPLISQLGTFPVRAFATI